MSVFETIMIRLSGNRYVQNLLEKNVLVSQNLMGIGSGANVFSSGEATILGEIVKRYQPPYCVFDVGSNKGQFLELILDNIPAKQLSIHSFEPGRVPFEILKNKYGDNELIKLNNLAVGRATGEASLYYDRQGSALASLTKRKLDHFNIDMNAMELVKVTTIDEYCSANDLEHINLLKIDVEGHEHDVLVGASEMFMSMKIDSVMFEFGGTNIDTKLFFQDFWYFFKEKNMKLFRITPSGYMYPIDSYREIHEQFRTTNFVALAKS